MSVQNRPWEGLDPAIAALIAPRLPAIAEEIIAAIGESVAEYQRPMEGAFGRAVRTAIEEALRAFLLAIGSPGSAVQTSGRDVYMALGRGEWRAGRGLEALQAAYRLGARISWRHVSVAARQGGVNAEALSLLAESIFAYIDEISAASVEGFASAQAMAAGEREARRERLAELLLAVEPADPVSLSQAAERAGWPLPREVAVLLVEDVRPVSLRLGESALAARADGVRCLLLADPDGPGRAEGLRAALGEGWAVVGSTVPARRARESWTVAAGIERLRTHNALPHEPVLRASDHLASLIVLDGDPLVRRELARRRIVLPLQALSPAARARTLETLRAWLDLQGSVPAVAERLQLHRQTVRYRLRRLVELYDGLEVDPQLRFELSLALRVVQTEQDGVQAEGPTTPH